MFRKKIVIFISLILLSIFFIIQNYLINRIPTIIEKTLSSNSDIEKEIYNELQHLPKDISHIKLNGLQSIFLISKSLRLADLWLESNNLPQKKLGDLILALKTKKIIKADLDTRGTQLKLLLTLESDQECIFKPKWYNEDAVITGPVYAGKDRYQAEILAFYLSQLLKPVTPVVVKRVISLKNEIFDVASTKLLETSFRKGNKSCIYGNCFYCKKEDPICDNNENSLTGAVIFNLKKSFSNYRSPWQRTYKKLKKADWEVNVHYCDIIKTKLSKHRLLDLIDTAIFDFLIQNGDRHHYEILDNEIIWLDNGKGLGNPFVQHNDILAPLYQCCLIRKKMLENLKKLSGGNLAKYLKMIPDINSTITSLHLKAMEKRLLYIFGTIEYCNKKIKDGKYML